MWERKKRREGEGGGEEREQGDRTRSPGEAREGGRQAGSGEGHTPCGKYLNDSGSGPIDSFFRLLCPQPGQRGQICLKVPRGNVGTAGHSGSQCPGVSLPTPPAQLGTQVSGSPGGLGRLRRTQPMLGGGHPG